MSINFSAPFGVIKDAFTRWWDDWYTMVFMGLLTLLCWLTIILGPPATFGLYHVVQEKGVGESMGYRDMFEAGKRYFLKSWIWMLTNLLVFFIWVSNYLFYGGFEAAWAGIMQTVTIALGLLWLGVQYYALPFMILQDEKKLSVGWRNGLYMILASPLYTLVIWVVVLLILASHALLAPLFLGGPAVIAVIGSHAVAERLDNFNIRNS
jgi:hypothetical protein